MGFYGAFYGATVVEIEAPAAPSPTTITSPLPTYESEYVDHIQAALDRLCQYAKFKADS